MLFRQKKIGSIVLIRLLFVVILLVSGFMPYGCSTEVSKEETMVKRGLVYRKGDTKPLTGAVKGIGREGHRRYKVKYKKVYKKGRLNGVSTFWYMNGKLESTEPYTNGKINGIVSRYYKSGQIKSKIHMVNGMRGGGQGERVWDENGKVIR